MGAGTPDWSKLAAMGKLPKEHSDKVPYLAEKNIAEDGITQLEEELEDAKKKISELENQTIDPLVDQKEEDNKKSDIVSFPVSCDVIGCGYTAVGKTEGMARNILRMHGKAHQTVE